MASQSQRAATKPGRLKAAGRAPSKRASAKTGTKQKTAADLPPHVAQYRDFVLSLPEVEEELKWGSPHFTVRGKIFSGLSQDGGDYYSSVVVNPELAASLVDDVQYSVAPYTGRYGGITMNLSKVPLERAQHLVQMSYCRSAPARLVQLLEVAAGDVSEGIERKASSRRVPR